MYQISHHRKTVTWEEMIDEYKHLFEVSCWLASTPAVLEVELKVQLAAGSVGMK